MKINFQQLERFSKGDSFKYLLRLLFLLLSSLMLFNRFKEMAFEYHFIVFINLASSLVFKKYGLSRWPLLILLAFFSIFIATDYYGAANHYFVVSYLLIGFIIESFVAESEKDNFNYYFQKYLLIGLLFFASVSKLASPEFINGSFLGWWILTGRAFPSLIEMISPKLIEHNIKVYSAFKTALITSPTTFLPLQVPFSERIFYFITIILSWATILIEVLLLIVYRIKEIKLWSHILFLLFIIGISSQIQEYEYLSLALLLGLSQIKDQTWLKYLYLLVIFVFTGFIIKTLYKLIYFFL